MVIAALIIAVVVGIWAAVDRSWQLLLLSIAVALLALAGSLDGSTIRFD